MTWTTGSRVTVQFGRLDLPEGHSYIEVILASTQCVHLRPPFRLVHRELSVSVLKLQLEEEVFFPVSTLHFRELTQGN